MKRRTLLGCFAGGAAISCAYQLFTSDRPQQTSEAITPFLSSTTVATSADFFGLNVGSELGWKSWRGKLMPLYQQLGVRWLRVWYNWSDIEAQKGNYQAAPVREALQLAKNKGFRILFVVWGTPAHAGSGKASAVPEALAFSKYCQWLQSYLGDLVDAWEIGNEPNLERYYAGSPAEYVGTLATAYQVLKGKGLVIAAAPSGAAKPHYWRSLLDSGLEQHCDRVNLHPYRQKPRDVVRTVDNFLEIIHKPLWITELGVAANHGNEKGKAEFTTEVVSHLTSRVEQLFWYRSVQGKKLHPLRFGIIEADRDSGKVTPLPAYYAYATQARKYQHTAT
jgi:Glycosyl hydrolase catalytic core